MIKLFLENNFFRPVERGSHKRRGLGSKGNCICKEQLVPKAIRSVVSYGDFVSRGLGKFCFLKKWSNFLPAGASKTFQERNRKFVIIDFSRRPLEEITLANAIDALREFVKKHTFVACLHTINKLRKDFLCAVDSSRIAFSHIFSHSQLSRSRGNKTPLEISP